MPRPVGVREDRYIVEVPANIQEIPRQVLQFRVKRSQWLQTLS